MSTPVSSLPFPIQLMGVGRVLGIGDIGGRVEVHMLVEALLLSPKKVSFPFPVALS